MRESGAPPDSIAIRCSLCSGCSHRRGRSCCRSLCLHFIEPKKSTIRSGAKPSLPTLERIAKAPLER